MANKHYEKLKQLENDMIRRLDEIDNNDQQQEVETSSEVDFNLEEEQIPGAVFRDKYHASLPRKKRNSLLYMLIFVLAMLALGIVIYFTAAWLKKDIAPEPQPPEDATRPAMSAGQNAAGTGHIFGDLSNVTIIEKEEQPEKVANTTHTPPAAPAKPAVQPVDSEHTPPPVPPRKAPAAVPPPIVHHVPVPVLQPEEYPARPIEASREYFKLKQWLHQAEELRRKGDWDGAISLYSRIWQQGQDPGVANNLAASLIFRKRFPEAQQVLKDALKLAPNDPDLLSNYQLVLQMQE